MGNCTGFCMTSTSDDNIKKVTTDKVKSALYEKDEMMRDGHRYDDDMGYGNKRESSSLKQGPRKLQSGK